MIIREAVTDYLHKDERINVWQARNHEYEFCLQLCKQFRDFEFFYVPDATLKDEIRKGNILAFDYNRLEAGYIWVTYPKTGKSRINQLAVDQELWRNKVGTVVTKVYESVADSFGMWATYLSCNSNTPGHDFWPKVGYTPILDKSAGRRGGKNIIWAKLLPRARDQLVPISVSDVKTKESYKNQSSITASVTQKNSHEDHQINLF